MLQVALTDVEKWIAGEKKPPRELFLRVVDLLIEDGAGADAADEPPPGREAAGEARAAFFD